MLKIYNTLSKKVEEFKPLNDTTVRLYTCGPTVYYFAHIGNFRSYIFADTIFRTLKFLGADVLWVMNITDVDDKTIKKTIGQYGNSAGIDQLRSYTDQYTDLFLKELADLHIDTKQIQIIRVSEVIPQIQKFILELMEKGYAYQTSDGVFFSIEKYQKDFQDYGALAGERFMEGKKIGARVAVDEYDKENLSDFALWKRHTPEDGQIFWEHPLLGRGRPGWHIECSAINRVAFGDHPTDIHTGGIDLAFPHHTNEIAQSQPFYRPFAQLWSHCEHLQVEGKKMAKSAGNYFTLKDLAEKDPQNILAFRYLCLQTDFRKPMNFTWQALEGAKNALERLSESYGLNNATISAQNGNTEIQTPQASENTIAFEQEFKESLKDNLNIAKALSVYWKVLDAMLTSAEKIYLWNKFDEVLGLELSHVSKQHGYVTVEIPDEIQELKKQRDEARKNRDFAVADALRKQIEDLGFLIQDDGETSKLIRI